MRKHIVVCLEPFVPKPPPFFLVLNTFNGEGAGWLPHMTQTCNPEVSGSRQISCGLSLTSFRSLLKCLFLEKPPLTINLELWPSYDAPPMLFFDQRENQTRHSHLTLRSKHSSHSVLKMAHLTS